MVLSLHQMAQTAARRPGKWPGRVRVQGSPSVASSDYGLSLSSSCPLAAKSYGLLAFGGSFVEDRSLPAAEAAVPRTSQGTPPWGLGGGGAAWRSALSPSSSCHVLQLEV